MEETRDEVRLECKTCKAVLDRTESLKTGGYCWKHKPKDMKPIKGRTVGLAGTGKLVKGYAPDIEPRTPKFPGIRSGKGYRWSREGLEDFIRLFNEEGYTLWKIHEDHNRPLSTVSTAVKSFMIKENGKLRLKDDNHLPRYLKDKTKTDKVKGMVRKPVEVVKKPEARETVKPVVTRPAESKDQFKETKVEVTRLVESPGPTALDIINKRMEDINNRKAILHKQIQNMNRSLAELELVKKAIDQKKYVTEG